MLKPTKYHAVDITLMSVQGLNMEDDYMSALKMFLMNHHKITTFLKKESIEVLAGFSREE